MNFNLTKTQKELSERCQKFAEKTILPQVKALEENLELRQSVFSKMAKEGFFTLALKKRYHRLSIGTQSHC